MRFPFTLMGVVSLGFGLWTASYFATHGGFDPFVAGSGWAAAAAMTGFGAYLVVRRLRHGPQG